MNRKNGPPASLSANRAFLTFEYSVLKVFKITLIFKRINLIIIKTTNYAF